MTLRISLLTIESENADPALMAALSELLERAGVSPTVVVTSDAPPAATSSALSQAVAESLMHGSLQEQVMDEVTRTPAITVEQLAGVILNDTTKGGVRRVRLAVDPLVTIGRLERSASGKLYTPAFAATLPKFQRPGKQRKAAPAPACPSFPPCAGCRNGTACVSIIKPSRPVAPEPEPPVHETPEPVPASEPEQPAPAPDVTPRPLSVPATSAPLPDLPGGRVEGFVAQAQQQGDLAERIVAAVEASPGSTVPNLTMALLGSGSQTNKRRIDMLVGPLVVSGRLARADGRLFPDLKSAQQWSGPRAPGRPSRAETSAPSSSPEGMYRQIVAAFAKDQAYPLPQLAVELFTDSSGRSVQKLQLMIRQLIASERLERTPEGYRPVTDSERRGRDEDNEDEDDDEESNGHSDDDDLQELDLG